MPCERHAHELLKQSAQLSARPWQPSMPKNAPIISRTQAMLDQSKFHPALAFLFNEIQRLRGGSQSMVPFHGRVEIAVHGGAHCVGPWPVGRGHQLILECEQHY